MLKKKEKCFSKPNSLNPDKVALDDIKDDIILIQFKIVSKDSERTLNTISFLNLPLSKAMDPNVMTLQEIMIKFNGGGKRDFMPYNKSILTRVLAP